MPYVINGDVALHYRVEGNGPPLLLHHGLSDSIDIWDELGYTERLRRRATLVMLDARGHGSSTKPHDPERYRLPELASDVIAVLDALGIAQAHYYGYSFGGWVGFGVAALAPQRIGSLILGGSHSFAESMAPYRELFAGGVERWLTAVEAQAGRRLEQMRARSDRIDLIALRALLAHDRAENALALRAITVPCTLFAGTADPRFAAVERSAQQMPQATFYQFAGANHVQAYLDADAVLEVIEQHLARVADQLESHVRLAWAGPPPLAGR